MIASTLLVAMHVFQKTVSGVLTALVVKVEDTGPEMLWLTVRLLLRTTAFCHATSWSWQNAPVGICSDVIRLMAELEVRASQQAG